MQRLKIAAFSIAFLSLVCQSGCKSDDSDLKKSNITSIQDVTEVSEEKSTDTTVDDPEKNTSDSAGTNTGNSTKTSETVKDNGSITATGSQSAVTSAKGETSSPSANESTDSAATVSPSQETTRKTETPTVSAEIREENSISSTDANTNSNEGEWDFNAPNKF